MEEQIAESGNVHVVSDKEAYVLAAEASDNFVMQRLLRGRRYFDPPNSYLRTCYKCGDEGHTAGNCTVAKLRKPCYKCGRRNHNVKRCTKRKDCLICKKVGHRAKDCPVKHPVPQDANTCLKCGDTGHDMFSCKTSYSADDLKDIRCYICRNLGHLCCVEYTDSGPAKVSCYRCGQLGHSGLKCFQSSGARSSNSCYICGEEGHLALKCSSSTEVGKRNVESVAPKTRFVKEDEHEVICLSNDCNGSHTNKDFNDGGSKTASDNMESPAPASNPKQKRLSTTNDQVASNGSELVAPKRRHAKVKKHEGIYLSNDCNSSHINEDFDDQGSKSGLDNMKWPASASNLKEKHEWTTNYEVASVGSELVTPMRSVRVKEHEVIHLSNDCNGSHTNKYFDDRGSKLALDNMEWPASTSNSKQKRVCTSNDQVASKRSEYKINGRTSHATQSHDDPPSDPPGNEEEISGESKKPVYTTPLGSLSPEDADKILEYLSKDQIVPILRSALLIHTDVLDAICTIADADRTQRKLFVRGLGWETTTGSLQNTFSTYGEIEEAIIVTDKANGKSKGYGFVIFKHIDAVILALKEPNKKIDGRITVTQLAASGNSQNSHSGDLSLRKIYVGNVPFKVSSERLLQYFSVYGEIEEGPLGFYKQNGNTKGYAFFVYRTEEGARASLSEPLKNLDGNKVVCKLASANKKVKTAGQGDDRMEVSPMLGSNFGVPGGYNGYHGTQGSGHAANGYGSGPAQYSGRHAAGEYGIGLSHLAGYRMPPSSTVMPPSGGHPGGRNYGPQTGYGSQFPQPAGPWVPPGRTYSMPPYY